MRGVHVYGGAGVTRLLLAIWMMLTWSGQALAGGSAEAPGHPGWLRRDVLATGASHSLALAPDGSVWGWGDNGFGQLGDETYKKHSLPVRVPGIDGVIAVAAGDYYSVALREDGSVWSWGYNSFDQLGVEGVASRAQPAPVEGLTDVVALAAGESHVLALRADGTVWAWGRNLEGQIGDEPWINSRAQPAPVPGLADVVAISAGQSTSLALRSDGSVWGWGDNRYGQLGDGTQLSRSTPAPVPGLSRIVSVDAGDDFSLALREDGSVQAWGYNGFGLGDGMSELRFSPTRVVELTDAVAISAGSSQAMALRADGTVWGWGRTMSLGAGLSGAQPSPARVALP